MNTEEQKLIDGLKEAEASFDRFVNGHFNRGGPKPKISIPANLADDDLVVSRFMRECVDRIKALSAEVEAAKGQKAEQFRLYCEETKKHNATAVELIEARKHAEWCSAKLVEHAEAAGINPDDLNFIDKTLSAIIATWTENSSLKAERDTLRAEVENLKTIIRAHSVGVVASAREAALAQAGAGDKEKAEPRNGQIIKSVGSDGTLYSENLY